MAVINTVCGPISPDQLGKTLVHEHLKFGYPGWYADTLHPEDNESLKKELIAEISKIKEQYGLGTMIDATPSDCGRDPVMLKEVSEATGVNIICSTGFYFEGQGAPAYLKLYEALSGDNTQLIYDIMHADLYDGIGNTGVKAGVIKLASSKDEITPYEEKFFRAASQMAVADSNIRIITHTQSGTMGLAQAQYFLDHGVNPKQVTIGHIDCCTDMQELTSILNLGFYLSFDRFGLEGIYDGPLHPIRVAIVSGLVAVGYGDQIMLSHDHVFKWLGAPFEYTNPEGVKNWHWDHIFKDIVPAFEKGGMKKEQIDRLLIDNPKEFFT